VCISINTIINFTTRLLRLQSNRGRFPFKDGIQGRDPRTAVIGVGLSEHSGLTLLSSEWRTLHLHEKNKPGELHRSTLHLHKNERGMCVYRVSVCVSPRGFEPLLSRCTASAEVPTVLRRGMCGMAGCVHKQTGVSRLV
jgi:hypothetical protein